MKVIDQTFGFALAEAWQLPALEHLYGADSDDIDLAHTRWIQTADVFVGAFCLTEFDTHLTLSRLKLCPGQDAALADAARRRLVAYAKALGKALLICPCAQPAPSMEAGGDDVDGAVPRLN